MGGKTPISLFPFLSVLISTMGVLSFLAVTFLLFSRSDALPRIVEQKVDVRWRGAPEHVQPVLVECREAGVTVHDRHSGDRRFFPRTALEEEVRILRRLELQGLAEPYLGLDRNQFWFYIISAIRNESRLQNTFTMEVHRLEMDNLRRRGRAGLEEGYPILLVYPKGIETYDLASYLVETATRLRKGVEPMLEGWALPYRDRRS